jgi:hypothetical protein
MGYIIYKGDYIMPSWLTVLFCFQLGWVPDGAIMFQKPWSQNGYAIEWNAPEQFDARIKIDAELFNILIIGGSFVTYFEDTPKYYFNPTGITFDFIAGIKISENISVFYNHSCSHPIIANFRNNKTYSTIDAFYNRVYIEIKGKLE